MELDSLLRIVLIAVGIGAIIFVHEMGHFLVAKLAGVRVDGFSLGFPPTGVGFRRTEEGIRVTVLPNFLAYYPLEVGGLRKGSPADDAGLTLGDRIVSVNDAPTERLTLAGLEALLAEQWSAGKAVTFTVEREGETFTLGPVEPPERADLLGFGLYPHLAAQKREIGRGEAWAWGLEPTDRVQSVGNRPMANREDFAKFALDAVSRGTGVVRLHVQEAAAQGEQEGREIVLLIQRPARKPSTTFMLPAFKGPRGDTEYRLSLIPVGGYVKMAGDAPGEGEGAPDEFLQKPVGSRAAIIAAGSITNIVFALFVFILAFQIGVRFESPVVGQVLPDSPAAKAGLKRGDRVLKIDGAVVTSFMDIPSEVAFSDPEAGAVFDIARDDGRGGTEHLSLRVYPKKDEKVGRLEVGIYPPFSNLVSGLRKDSAFEKAGLRVKDRIVEIQGRTVTDQLSLNKAWFSVQSEGRRSITFSVDRDGQRKGPFELALPDDVERVWRIGVTPDMRFILKSASVEDAPFEEGDVILSVAGKPVGGRSLEKAVADALGKSLSGEVTFLVRRVDEELFLTRRFGGAEEFRAFFKRIRITCVASVQRIAPESTYSKVGGALGDSILRISGKEFESLAEMQKLIQASEGEAIEVAWKTCGGEEKTQVLRPLGQWKTGLDKLGLAELMVETEDVQLSLGDSIVVGFQKSVKFAADVFKMLKGIFTRKLSPKNLGGPVMIVKASFHFAEHGLGKLLFFLGILGVNLGIINLFPIPILDGGHLVFLFIEKVKGSPVSEGVQVIAQYAGLLVLLLLMIYVTAQDVIKLAQ